MAKRKASNTTMSLEAMLTTRFERIKGLIRQQNDFEAAQSALDWLEYILTPLHDDTQQHTKTLGTIPELPKPVQFAAVGMRYRGDHRFEPNDTLSLDPEPTNPYDVNAIRILLHNNDEDAVEPRTHVAYVARSDCPAVHAFLQTLDSSVSYTLNLCSQFTNSAVFQLSACNKT